MRRKTSWIFAGLIVTLGAAILVPDVVRAQPIVADHTVVGDFSLIPEEVVTQVKAGYRIFYGHTSHGSQVVTGMDMIQSENSLYSFSLNNGEDSLSLTEYGDDLGPSGDTSWVPITRQRLDDPYYNINMVMWSWCGQVSGATEEEISLYLSAMNTLEQDYPNVRFVYMTGHLDGSGPTENLYIRNNQIRAWCTANNKILFDFADIESYDPEGTYYPDGSDDCAWCSAWCASHTCPSCDGCAHSHCFNCYQKGKAFWWMMATVDGWGGEVLDSCVGIRGNADSDAQDRVNVSDVTFLLRYCFGIPPGLAPRCPEEANVNGDAEEKVNVTDITYLLAYLFGTPIGPPPPNCP